MYWIQLIQISVIICYLIDLSGIIQTIKYALWKRLFKRVGRPEDIRLKPFDCTLCSIWWTGIILMLATGQFTLFNLLITALISYLSKHISELLLIINDLLVSIETLVNRLIQKI